MTGAMAAATASTVPATTAGRTEARSVQCASSAYPPTQNACLFTDGNKAGVCEREPKARAIREGEGLENSRALDYGKLLPSVGTRQTEAHRIHFE